MAEPVTVSSAMVRMVLNYEEIVEPRQASQTKFQKLKQCTAEGHKPVSKPGDLNKKNFYEAPKQGVCSPTLQLWVDDTTSKSSCNGFFQDRCPKQNGKKS